MTNPCRFIVLGTGSDFTCRVLQSLIRQYFVPLAYIQSGNSAQGVSRPSRFAEIEIQQPKRTLIQLLEDHSVPVYFASQHRLSTLIRRQRAEYLLVACWPALLTGQVIRSVSIAALNLHPSLLPAFRGIDPVGDQLQTSDSRFGVTLHLLNARFDEGDIVLQQATGPFMAQEKRQIEAVAARVGAALFIRAVQTHVDPGWVLTKQSQNHDA